MKIVLFEMEMWEREVFKKLGEQHEIVALRETLNKQTIREHANADIVSIFIYSKLTADLLAEFDNLKLIATRSTGYNHIDIDYCNNNGIVVSNVPTYGENTVAEHVFALLLTISHHMFESIERTRDGKFTFEGLQGFDLRGRTIGVIGTGHIGESVIKIARGFGMKVLAYDVNPDEQKARNLGFEYVGMDDVLANSDIITLHVPATENTYHLISDEEFQKMKQGVVLINTARGSVVSNRALIRALHEKKVRAAGLDVLPGEPVIREEAELLRSVYQQKYDLQSLLADQILLHLSNVYVTPHNAFNTREAVKRILDTTAENIQGYINGKPQNVVNEVSRAKEFVHK